MKITLYRFFPERARKLIRYGYSLFPIYYRLGRTYRATKRFIGTSEQWDSKRIESWQLKRLKEIIVHAYDTVPGYRKLYESVGFTPADFRELGDMKRIPFVTKELMRDNIDDFVSRSVPKWKRLYRTTGGSTGIPFGFYLVQSDVEREMAFLHSSWERAGWQLGDMSAVLRGAFIGTEDKFWDYDPFLKDLRLSSYYLNERTYRRYKEKLLDATPQHLQAYPSAASLLADLVSESGDQGRFRFKLLLLGSENLYEWQKEKILEAFPEARIFSWYGHAEQVLFAPMCEKSEQFHLDPIYGFAEILNKENMEIARGETGELVGTSLWNTTTPFIRYRTMDFARKGMRFCPSCGRQHQMLESIEGRLQELIVTKSGRYISMTAINMHNDIFDNVKQFQFHQNEAGKIVLNIVRGNSYTDRDSQRIHSELMKKLGSDVNLEIAFVETIARQKNGKLRFLIQRLPLAYGDHE